jgi:hypothetical protein
MRLTAYAADLSALDRLNVVLQRALDRIAASGIPEAHDEPIIDA